MRRFPRSLPRHRRPAWSAVVGGWLVLLLAPWPAARAADPAPDPVFPLRVDAAGRHLVDQRDRPFFYQADTAWMLPLKLGVAEADEYFRVRKAQGFTAVQVQFTGFAGMTNLNGDLPFAGDQDFERPNERFFAHVDAITDRAAAHGLLLAAAPLWAGCCGEGWAGHTREGRPLPLNAQGAEKARDFGRWLGRRFARHQHLLWILGGDNDPGPAREAYRALAAGLRGAAPHQLITFHAASSHSSTDAWPGESWIDVSMIYTYFRGFNKAWNRNQPDVYEVGWEEHARRPRRPFFLGESTYEGEHDAWGSPLQVRKQAWWAVLSGGIGHAYGSPNWRAEPGWREGLQLPGAASLVHLRRTLEARDWWTLEPDAPARLLADGAGPVARNDLAVAALSRTGERERAFALVYLPSPRTVTLQLDTLAATPNLAVRWLDPASGATTDAGRIPASGRRAFTPPSRPDAGDWVLLLDAAPAP